RLDMIEKLHDVLTRLQDMIEKLHDVLARLYDLIDPRDFGFTNSGFWCTAAKQLRGRPRRGL
ncbi:MAG: hypothetical protein KAW12_18440, partial [Candidatus Aminicenantes bacterium]|nr:hypothetical protein [Candidatus Aminicenantes bacterium]